MDGFTKLVIKIIEEQETIIGPLAVEQAKKVPGIKLDWSNKHQISLEGDRKLILEQLTKQYQSIFGQASVEVCRMVVHKLFSQILPNEIPIILQ